MNNESRALRFPVAFRRPVPLHCAYMHGRRDLPFLTVVDPNDRHRLFAVSAFATEHLSGLKRRSGESYAENGREVAATLVEVTHDPALVAVALLHDLPLHPDGETLMKSAPLSEEEKTLVRRMHTLRGLHIDMVSQDLDKVIEAFLEDPRLLPLRMAHRLTDIRHLRRFAKSVQRDLARESLHKYAAIAGRLGMHAWRHEMEDACFLYLKPEAAKSLQRQFRLHAGNDRECFRHVRRFLSGKLCASRIASSMSSRTKTLYSTYCKMIVKRRKFEELTDRLALRIIVPTVEDCYRTLGIIHTSLRPMPGKLKDYIGAPKENGYRSIHTVIYPLPGVTEYPVEIQVRTPAMHEDCELGPARHVDYKRLTYALGSGIARVDLFRNLQSLKEHTRSPEQFETALRTYFNDDHLALFDHHSNLYHILKPVTALDFVCHTAGKRVRYLKDVRINGRTRTFDTQLHDGDTIEAKFGKVSRLTPDWLRACRHRGARTLCTSLLKAA